MAGKCDVCGRTPQFGHNVSHSNRKTRRVWALNLKHTTITINGRRRGGNICTRCLRTMAKVGD